MLPFGNLKNSINKNDKRLLKVVAIFTLIGVIVLSTTAYLCTELAKTYNQVRTENTDYVPSTSSEISPINYAKEISCQGSSECGEYIKIDNVNIESIKLDKSKNQLKNRNWKWEATVGAIGVWSIIMIGVNALWYQVCSFTILAFVGVSIPGQIIGHISTCLISDI